MTDIAGLELEIDCRLVEMWEMKALSSLEGHTAAVIAAAARWAYSRGHDDALLSPNPQALYLNYGYAVPKRRAA